MGDGSLGLINGAALDRKHNVPLRLPAKSHDPRPINDAFATRATDWGAGDFASLGIGLGGGYVLGVQMHQMIHDFCKPLVRIMAAQVAVAGVEVYPDGRAFHQFANTIETGGVFAVLLVRFEAD